MQFFPELIKNGHVFILETPLISGFEIINETIYTYGNGKNNAVKKLTGNKEITRFKGLGEISPNEFKKIYR